jgi:hypothetical protein
MQRGSTHHCARRGSGDVRGGLGVGNLLRVCLSCEGKGGKQRHPSIGPPSKSQLSCLRHVSAPGGAVVAGDVRDLHSIKVSTGLKLCLTWGLDARIVIAQRGADRACVGYPWPCRPKDDIGLCPCAARREFEAVSAPGHEERRKDQGGASVLATRKPKMVKRTVESSLRRLADRRSLGRFAQEPPRATREQPNTLGPALPSVGAPA